MAIKVKDLFEDTLKDFGTPGLAAGIGAVVLAPFLIPAVAKVGKPIVKAAIKGGILLYEKGKGVVAETGEVFEDLVAEAKAELSEAQTPYELESTQAHSEA